MTDCLFCKLAAGELGTKFIYEDNDIIGFEDINPQAPHHCLVIPKLHITTLNDLDDEHQKLSGKMILAATHIAKERNISDEGYRLVMNCNQKGGQTVYHIHLHILGGRQLNWPPG